MHDIDEMTTDTILLFSVKNAGMFWMRQRRQEAEGSMHPAAQQGDLLLPRGFPLGRKKVGVLA